MTSQDRRRKLPAIAVCLVALLPAACAMPRPAPLPPPNPFVGSWKNRDGDKITFRPDTVVLDQPNAAGTVLDKGTCRGVFRFDYATKDRAALTALISRQPELRKQLSDLLVQPDYPVAELGCDQGDHTYILLGDRDLVAVFRDGDIAGIERLSRL